MAVRTTALAVGGIIEVNDGDDLDPFIETANYLVDACCLYASDGTTSLGYTDTQLELIERWLSAHFYAIYEPRSFLDQVGDLRQQIESKVNLRLEVTRYGQQAMLLDFKGGLAALSNGLGEVEKKFPDVTGRKPTITWLGKRRTTRSC